MVRDHFGEATKPDDDAEVSILLASGKEWRPFRPRPEDFEWEDIGLAAARIPRFNGQLSPRHAVNPWDNYVLAQHLCLCSDLLKIHCPDAPIDLRLAVHLHDGEEPLGGLGDPVGPVKHSPRFRELFKAYFAPILQAIAAKAGIAPELLNGHPDVKRWDKLAYRIENAKLRGIGQDSCPAIPMRHERSDGEFAVWRTIVAYENWMQKLNMLLAIKAEQETRHG